MARIDAREYTCSGRALLPQSVDDAIIVTQHSLQLSAMTSGAQVASGADARRLRALADHIKTLGRNLGFDAIGITDTDLSRYRAHLHAWLAEGAEGEMSYMRRNIDKRLDPGTLEPGTVRVISARMNYLPEGTQPLEVLADATRAYVARYALGRDYHKLIRKRLAMLAGQIREAAEGVGRYRAFTDSAPVLEKALSEKAGVGWIGKNTLLLDEHAGSWFFLGEVFTDLPLPVDAGGESGVQDLCGKCRACMSVCPTGAITAARRLDARRCIAYLTIEHKTAIPVELRPLMGNRIFGCDDCQLVCPWNRAAPHTREAAFAPRHGLDGADLLALFIWDEATFTERTQGMALRRINFEQWQRNIAVALGNAPASDAIIAALEHRRDSASPMVREHIDWALGEQRKGNSE